MPDIAELIGPVVDLGFARDAVVAPTLYPVDGGRHVEDVLDRQVTLQAVNHDRFGLGAVARRCARALAELNAVEPLDLCAHEKIQ